jgi:hypothetical protein
VPPSTPPLTPEGAAVVVPAYQEEQRVGATVRAVRGLPRVDLVVVVDDGSADGTAAAAAAAGAVVVRSPGNGGKASAMALGAQRVAELEHSSGLGPRPLLFLDADLEESAAGAGPLLEPVLAGVAEMTVARLPDQPGGGRGFVVRLARDGVREATGWEPTQPLSGQRALTRAAFDAALPLAQGWGVEVGMSIDLLRQGFRVTEVPVDLRHRVTGGDWRAQAHRGRQFWGVWRALRARGVGPRLPLPR